MKFTHYKNAEIAYSDEGSGKVVVLLHGFLENSNMWQFLQPELTKHYRVICIDLLGHGKSESVGYVHTMEEMADAVYEVLTHLQIEKATFIGHSMGGYVSLAFIDLYPDLVDGLVLLNSTSYADSEERKANRDRAILAVKHNYKAAISMSIANLFSEENREKLLEEINWAKGEALQTPLQGIVAAQEGMKVRIDRERLLHNTNFPKLLILGQKDPVLPFDDNKLQVINTKTKLVSFSGGHMSHLENKIELEKEILSFLKMY